MEGVGGAVVAAFSSGEAAVAQGEGVVVVAMGPVGHGSQGVLSPSCAPQGRRGHRAKTSHAQTDLSPFGTALQSDDSRCERAHRHKQADIVGELEGEAVELGKIKLSKVDGAAASIEHGKPVERHLRVGSTQSAHTHGLHASGTAIVAQIDAGQLAQGIGGRHDAAPGKPFGTDFPTRGGLLVPLRQTEGGRLGFAQQTVARRGRRWAIGGREHRLSLGTKDGTNTQQRHP